MYRRVFKCSLP